MGNSRGKHANNFHPDEFRGRFKIEIGYSQTKKCEAARHGEFDVAGEGLSCMNVYEHRHHQGSDTLVTHYFICDMWFMERRQR